MRRRGAAVLGILAIAAAAALVYSAFVPPLPPPPDRLVLVRESFAALAGWAEDSHAEATPAFLRSCARIERRADGDDMGGHGIAGTAADWRQPCAAAAKLAPGDDDAARRFLEAEFVPFAIHNSNDAGGLFTGYYEPTLKGSLRADNRHTVPLYRRPPDLVTAKLGAFDADLAGRRIVGRVSEGRLAPYPSRADIDRGALAARGLELVWVEDRVAAFFLHIQGSGRIELDDGTLMRVGYGGQNGHAYVAIGRVLVARGALTPESVSLQSIRAWLLEHPDEAAALMAENPSYVFFRRIEGEGPIGAEGSVLTAGRSIAVDRRYLPLGVPMWLDAMSPAPSGSGPDRPLRRVMIAQDTGGAIRGPVRGDVFWGHEAEAEAVAGRMKHRGRYYILLPRAVAERVTSGAG